MYIRMHTQTYTCTAQILGACNSGKEIARKAPKWKIARRTNMKGYIIVLKRKYLFITFHLHSYSVKTEIFVHNFLSIFVRVFSIDYISTKFLFEKLCLIKKYIIYKTSRANSASVLKAHIYFLIYNFCTKELKTVYSNRHVAEKSAVPEKGRLHQRNAACTEKHVFK